VQNYVEYKATLLEVPMLKVKEDYKNQIPYLWLRGFGHDVLLKRSSGQNSTPATTKKTIKRVLGYLKGGGFELA